VPLAETIVHTRESTVKSANSAVKRAGMKAAAMEAAASVKTPAPAVRAGVGEVRLAERSSEQQSTRDQSQYPSQPGPNSMFV
jgi:imidazoleglycerol phosphate synthase glutamine amidotransferase subunit HisH